MLWLSLGENCLPDGVLKRHDLKAFSTPYSHGRTNVDYAIALEKSGYSGLIDASNLIVGNAWGQKVVRSRVYNRSDDIFEPSVSKGFEFTHHDILKNKTALESYIRKINRIKQTRGS